MTDKFDRLSAETDYILNITTDQWDHYYWYTIDLFRQHNDINMELKKVICNNFNLSSWNKSLVIDRYSIQIGDHDFILEYLSKYMDLVKNQWWIILSGDALKIIKFNNITSKIYN